MPILWLEEIKNYKNIMVATNSSMLPIGTKANYFALEDVQSKKIVELQKGNEFKGYLIAFICNHCPFVIHLLEHLTVQFNALQKEGIKVLSISSNDIEKYPQDSPEKMRLLAENYGFEFPYLFDESQEVAISFKAACTPDFFLFDANLELFYRGRYDSSRPGSNHPVTGEDLLKAVQCIKLDSIYPQKQMPSIGCNIKWYPNREPNYFQK